MGWAALRVGLVQHHHVHRLTCLQFWAGNLHFAAGLNVVFMCSTFCIAEPPFYFPSPRPTFLSRTT